MENEQVIEVLMDIQSACKNGNEIEAIEVAIETLEMQIAKAPDVVGMQNKCPNIDCFESVLRYENYCNECGQKLDWE